jgi:hypothetical protein
MMDMVVFGDGVHADHVDLLEVGAVTSPPGRA